MANLFINPAPYGDIRFVNDKKANIISYPNSKLVSPYPGVVVNDLTPPCADSIKIKHSFNGETVYSVFCGAKTSVVMGGDVVRQGETIGSFGDDKIKYYIIDKYDVEKPLNDYFSDKNKNPKTTTTTTNPKPTFGGVLNIKGAGASSFFLIAAPCKVARFGVPGCGQY